MGKAETIGVVQPEEKKLQSDLIVPEEGTRKMERDCLQESAVTG